MANPAPYRVGRDVKAACRVCHGDSAHWQGKNAQGVAARHAQATGHEVWCEVYLSITYNPTEEASG